MNSFQRAFGMMGNAPKNVNPLAQLMRGGMSERDIFNNLMQSNSDFREFMQSVEGKTPQQVAKERGVDLKQLVNRFMK